MNKSCVPFQCWVPVNNEGGPSCVIPHDHDVHLALSKFQSSKPQQIMKCHFGMQTSLNVKIRPGFLIHLCNNNWA